MSAAFHCDYTTLGLWLSGIYGLVVAGYVAVKLLRFSAWLVRRLAGKPNPRLRPFALWDQMYEVGGVLRDPSSIQPSCARP